MLIAQVVSRIRHDQAVHRRRGNPRHHHGSDHQTIRLAPVVSTTVSTAQFSNVRKASKAVIEIGLRAVP
jgi:hypothetical protein